MADKGKKKPAKRPAARGKGAAARTPAAKGGGSGPAEPAVDAAPSSSVQPVQLRDEMERSFIDYADRKSTRLNSSHVSESRMPSSA